MRKNEGIIRRALLATPMVNFTKHLNLRVEVDCSRCVFCTAVEGPDWGRWNVAISFGTDVTTHTSSATFIVLSLQVTASHKQYYGVLLMTGHCVDVLCYDYLFVRAPTSPANFLIRADALTTFYLLRLTCPFRSSRRLRFNLLPFNFFSYLFIYSVVQRCQQLERRHHCLLR